MGQMTLKDYSFPSGHSFFSSFYSLFIPSMDFYFIFFLKDKNEWLMLNIES